MLDPKLIRHQSDVVKDSLARRGMETCPERAITLED